MAIYLVEISIFEDTDSSMEQVKDAIETAITNEGFSWGHIDIKKAKIVKIVVAG